MIGGCLSSRWSAWEDRGADVWVVQVLREGYVVPFHTPPPLSQVPVTLHSYSPQSIKGRVLKLEIQDVAQGCNRTGVPDSGILQPHFLGDQGVWRVEAHHRPLHSEQLCDENPLPDGDYLVGSSVHSS